MKNKEKIEEILITLSIGGKPALTVFLAKDGTINRMGYGNLEAPDKDLIIGGSNGQYFKEFMGQIDESYFDYAGTYISPNKQGKECVLIVMFGGNDIDCRFEYNFGLESEGPHKEIAELVKNAIQITEPWYQQHKQSVTIGKAGGLTAH